MHYLLFLLLLFLFESLGSFVGSDQLREVSHVLVCLLQQVGQTLVFLLIDQLAVAFLILGLRKDARAGHIQSSKTEPVVLL